MMKRDDPPDGDRSVDVSAADFRALFEAVSNWGRWGDDDERGALNYLTPDRVAAAAAADSERGDNDSEPTPEYGPAMDNPVPADHHMTMLDDVDIGSGTLRFAKDYIGADYHNDGHSHIDALCHVAFDGSLYNGKPSGSITSEGAPVDAIEVVKDGIVGRGVLLDVPRLRGVPWLEPGEHVFRADLEGAERAQGVTVADGDILLVRTGHSRRLAELGPWDTPKAKAGLHPTAVTFLADRHISVLGSDGNSDTAPSTTEGIDFPIHTLTLNAMGVLLLDYLQFEDLAAVCERERRWEFLFVGAPLRVVDGTGSPINPIAVF